MGEYSGPLKSVIEKGLLEKVVPVCGDEVLMHIAKVSDEQAVNAATSNTPFLDREYERWVHRMARVVTRINGHVFPSVEDALGFFKALSQPHMEEFVTAYSKMTKEIQAKLVPMAQEIKNS